KTAIEYEIRIRDLYVEAAAKTSDPVGRRIFQTLGDDEQHHVDYLTSRLDIWQQTGKLKIEKLESIVPPKEMITGELGKLQQRMSADDRKDEKQMLGKALKVEVETSGFYKRMVAAMSGEGRLMFARFLEIEDAHIDAVQAELDYITQTGYWLDFKEFDME
ncbi:MAG: rubrerythrin, partial [Proteobacteria bacterium]|nr:rubrerythrin [Pseudomonadota bacterium]